MLITHRYYITTIIAIFLSLSLGILIGGTLGQQWINEKQQSLISHFQNKTEKLVEVNGELEKQNQELHLAYQQIKDDYQFIFNKSISYLLEGKQVLWLNHDEENEFEILKTTIQNAGAVLFQTNIENENQYYAYDYDSLLIVAKSQDDYDLGKELSKYKVPIILINSKDKGKIEKLDKKEDIYVQNINENSLNDQYQFIYFLKKLLEENNHGTP